MHHCPVRLPSEGVRGIVWLFVCLLVCLSARITPKPLGRTSPNYVCILPIGVAQSFSERIAICCVLPVLWMSLYFQIVALRCVICVAKRRQNTTSITAEIPTKFQSTIKATGTYFEFYTGAKFAVYDCLVSEQHEGDRLRIRSQQPADSKWRTSST